MKIGFDNEKYLKIQSEHIRERIAQFSMAVVSLLLMATVFFCPPLVLAMVPNSTILAFSAAIGPLH